MSSRPSTIRSTRISETRELSRVVAGRVKKTGASAGKIINAESNSLLDQFQRLNGRFSRTNKNSNVKGAELISGKRRRGGRGLMRAALLTCGMAISVGAALLLSSSTTINWDGIRAETYQFIHTLRDKLDEGFITLKNKTLGA